MNYLQITFCFNEDPPLRRDSFSPGYRQKSVCSPPPAPSARPLLAGMGVQGGHMVPVFALSTKGSYYIPMSLDSTMLGSYQPLLVEDSIGPFHPVTISVKFTSLQEPAEDSRNWRNPRQGVISNQQSVIKHWKDPPA